MVQYYSILCSIGNHALKLKPDGVNDKYTYAEVSEYLAMYLRRYRANKKRIRHLWSSTNLPKTIVGKKNKRLNKYWIIEDPVQGQIHLTIKEE